MPTRPYSLVSRSPSSPICRTSTSIGVMLHSEERARESLPHPLRASLAPDDDGEGAIIEDGGQTGPQVQAGPGDCTTPVLERGCGSAHGDAPCGTARKRVISQMCSDFGFEAGLTKKRKVGSFLSCVPPHFPPERG